MHNCRFALICRTVPHLSYLPISFNCRVWCGGWDLLCKMSNLSLLHLLNVLVSSSQTMLLSNTILTFEADSSLPIRDRFNLQMKWSNSAYKYFSSLLPHSYTSPQIWGTSDTLGSLCVPMPHAHLEGAVMLPALGCVFILHLLSKVCTK